jgi:hypothetical protein
MRTTLPLVPDQPLGARPDADAEVCPEVVSRFFARVIKNTDTRCWGWSGALRNGYSYLDIDGRKIRGHRLSWEIHNGPIPDGMMVLHHCDNPPCCNPDHLKLGDAYQNAIDRHLHGTQWAARKILAQPLDIKPDDPPVRVCVLTQGELQRFEKTGEISCQNHKHEFPHVAITAVKMGLARPLPGFPAAVCTV